MQDILEKRSQKLHHLSIEWVGLAWNSSKLPSGILYILAIKNTNHQHQNACLYFLLTSFNAIYIYIYITSMNCQFPSKTERSLSNPNDGFWVVSTLWNHLASNKNGIPNFPPNKNSTVPHLLQFYPWSCSQVFPLDGVLHHFPQGWRVRFHQPRFPWINGDFPMIWSEVAWDCNRIWPDYCWLSWNSPLHHPKNIGAHLEGNK